MRLATLLVVLVGAAMLRRYGYRERPEAAASDEVQPSPFLTTRVADASQYNVSRAKHSVDMAGAAYCSGNVGHGVSTWSCKVCKRYPGVEATEVSDKPTNANGFVAYDALDGPRGAIYVSFAGTDPVSIRGGSTILIFARGCPVLHGQRLLRLRVPLDSMLRTIPCAPNARRGSQIRWCAPHVDVR